MTKLPRLTLRLRLSLSIVAIVLLFTLTNITYQVSSDNRKLRLDNLQNAVASQLASVDVRQQLEKQQQQILVLDALRGSDQERISEAEIEERLEDLLDLSLELEQLNRYVYQSARPTYDDLLARHQQLQDLWHRFYAGYAQGNTPPAAEIEAAYSATLQQLNQFGSEEIQAAEQKTRELQRNDRFTDTVTQAVFLFAIVLTISLGFLLIRYTNRSLREMNIGTVRIGGGDLDYHIPVNSDDEIGDLAIAFNEMSDKLRNAMAQVQQSKEKADQANRAKTNFLANMSHELRTPLNAIIGYSEMIIEDYREEKTLNEEQAVDDLQRILSSGRHLLQLINDVLDLAKIESGNMTVFKENFNSVEILEDLLTTMDPAARKGGNTLVLEQSDDIPLLYSDAVKFRQVFLNLLSNACKFTHDGKISVLVGYNEQLRQIVYHVSDTGIGMTPAQLNRVFEAFVQADSTTSKKYGGTGLGLAICKEFVELMEGTMDVSSAKDVGTTFTISLPAQAAVSVRHGAIPNANQQELGLTVEEAAAQVPEFDGQLGLVLVIDDDPRARQLLLRHLEKEGYAAIEADNAQDGIELAERQQPDMIMLDLMMPDIDGWTALSVLKERETTRHIPVILQSMLDEQHLGLDLGAAEFLPKPVDRQRMATVLRQLNPTDRRGTALLVAPESETRERLITELTDEAWQCLVASTRAQATDRLQHKRPDLVLLGLGMPVDSVVDILAMLRSELGNGEHSPPPIYVVSEKAPGPNEARRLDLPADQIILFDNDNQQAMAAILKQEI